MSEWRKASSSNGSGGSNCVQVRAGDNDTIEIRDSKNPDGHVLVFTRAEWDAFQEGVNLGEFSDI